MENLRTGHRESGGAGPPGDLYDHLREKLAFGAVRVTKTYKVFLLRGQPAGDKFRCVPAEELNEGSVLDAIVTALSMTKMWTDISVNLLEPGWDLWLPDLYDDEGHGVASPLKPVPTGSGALAKKVLKQVAEIVLDPDDPLRRLWEAFFSWSPLGLGYAMKFVQFHDAQNLVSAVGLRAARRHAKGDKAAIRNPNAFFAAVLRNLVMTFLDRRESTISVPVDVADSHDEAEQRERQEYHCWLLGKARSLATEVEWNAVVRSATRNDTDAAETSPPLSDAERAAIHRHYQRCLAEGLLAV